MKRSTLRAPRKANRSCKRTYLVYVFALFLTGHLPLVSAAQTGGAIAYPAWVPLINVRHFGAVGDGKHDDTKAIQDAIQSRKGSRQLFFPEGVYLISKPLVSLNSEGEGQAWLQLYGSGRDQTKIVLRSGSPEFQEAERPVAMIQFRAAREPVNGVWLERPNVAFFNSVYNLTIDVGGGNPGAIGIDWLVCNAGSLRHVNIVSSDPDFKGAVGVRMAENDGTAYIHDVRIDGFDYGFYRAGNAQSLAVEGLHLANQRKAGICNHNSVLAIHNLTSENEVPALIQTGGTAQASILDCRINGASAEAFRLEHPDAMLYLRNIQADRHRVVVKTADHKSIRLGAAEWFSHPAATAGAKASLNLPIHQAPEYHSNDTATWALVSRFPDDGTGDYSVRLQKAIDSGAETIVMDGKGSGKYKSQVIVRGKVRRIIGFWQSSAVSREASFVQPFGHETYDRLTEALKQDATYRGAFFMVIEDTAGDFLTIEQFHHFPGAILNNSSKVVVLRDMGVHGYVNTSRSTNDLYVEGCMGAYYRIGHGQRAWLRSVDAVFGQGPDIRADASTVWVLSNRTEGGGIFIEARNGAEVEIISTTQFIGSKGVGDGIAYLCHDSRLSIINFSDMGFMKHGAYQTLVKEINEGKVKEVHRSSHGVFKRDNLNRMILYRSSK